MMLAILTTRNVILYVQYTKAPDCFTVCRFPAGLSALGNTTVMRAALEGPRCNKECIVHFLHADMVLPLLLTQV